jgi:hypothetical protein
MASAATTGTRHRLIVADAEPPPELGLPRLLPYAGADTTDAAVLRGPLATPARVLTELLGADEVELDVHGLGGSASSTLALTPDAAGHFSLTAADILGLRLPRAPLVVLGACNAARATPFVHQPWSLPMAFVRAGARAVLGSASPLPDRDAKRFFDDVLSRVHSGSRPAIALRDARLEHLRAGRNWVADVMLFQ